MIETDEEYLSYNAYISNIEKINIRSEPYMLGMQYHPGVMIPACHVDYQAQVCLGARTRCGLD